MTDLKTSVDEATPREVRTTERRRQWVRTVSEWESTCPERFSMIFDCTRPLYNSNLTRNYLKKKQGVDCIRVERRS